MKDKRIAVVTGGTGFVGSHLVDLLINEGFHVRCITRGSSNISYLKTRGVEIVPCGLDDKEALKPVVKDADYLYHIAGVVKSKKPEGYYNGNVLPTKNLLDALLEVNPGIKRVMITSSQTAAGPSSKDRAVREDDRPAPITNYGRSKMAEEELARGYMDRLSVSIVRPPAVYGERDTEVYLIFKAFQKGIMTLVGLNKKQLSIIHADDLVRGIFMASQSQKASGETYFISSKEYYDWDQIADVISEVMGSRAIRLRIPHAIVYTVAVIAQALSVFSKKAATFNIEKAKDFVQQRWTCDPSKAREDFGFEQQISLLDGMKRTVQWYKKEGWL